MKIAGVVLLLCAAGIVVAAQGQTRRIHVSALDSNGNPIDDLTAADFAVKDGGKAREIVRVEPALARMQIAILVDDNGTGLFRVSDAPSMETHPGRATFSSITVHG